MKILLIEPPLNPFNVPVGLAALAEPYALEILAATVPDHEVRILDMRINLSLAGELDTFQPDLVGVTAATANLHLALRMLKQAKIASPEIKTVIGGHHASLIPQDCFSDNTDIIVIGEGEKTFPELIQALDDGKFLNSIAGLYYKENGNYFFTGERPLIEINTMPVAKRALTERYRNKYFRGSWRPTASITFSRGCPFRCDFCAQWKIYRGKFRIRDPRSVVKELGEIKEKYINFIDDNTTEDYNLARELADLIKSEGIRKVYEIYSRADTITKHPDLIEKWREIGLQLVLIGLESITQERLYNMNKRISLKTNEEAIAILNRNNIEIAAYFIIDPNFDKKDFEDLSSYIDDKKLTHPIFSILNPFPGTELRKKRKMELITNSYELLDCFHTVLPTRLPLDEFYRHFAELYFHAYSPKKTLKYIFRSKALLSPRLIHNNIKIRKKLMELQSHHQKTIS